MMASLSWASGCPAWAALVTSLTAPARSPAWYRCPAWAYAEAPGSCSQYGAPAADIKLVREVEAANLEGYDGERPADIIAWIEKLRTKS